MLQLLGDATILSQGDVLKLADRAGGAGGTEIFTDKKSKWTLEGHAIGHGTIVELRNGKAKFWAWAKCSRDDTGRINTKDGLEIAIRRVFDRYHGKFTHPGERDFRHKRQNGNGFRDPYGGVVIRSSAVKQVAKARDAEVAKLLECQRLANVT